MSLDMIVSVGNAAAVAIPRRRAATAFHEAGHAVVAFHLRMPVRDVSILASGDAEGHVLHYAFPSWFQPDIETGARAEKLIADRVLIALAGREAERRFSGRYNNAGASLDMAAAAELAMHVNSSAEATEAYLAWLQIRARDLVSGDAMLWPSIEQLADDLSEKATISGKDLRARLPAMSHQIHVKGDAAACLSGFATMIEVHR